MGSTLCEPAEEYPESVPIGGDNGSNNNNNNNNNDGEEKQQQHREGEEDDDEGDTYPVYENVPEEDAPTDCFLCRTHRQGPCRSPWRSFEYCAKDHATASDGDDDDGATRCAVFVKAFQECWMKHLNLYLLIAMTLNQERIREVERECQQQPTQSRTDLQANIVWQEWNNVSDQEGFSDLCDRVRAVFANYDKSTPVWKVYDTFDEEPFVVNVPCHVPTRRPHGRMLKTVYGLDQDNRAIGLADYDPQYEITKAESEGREPELESHRLVLTLVPGITEAVQIKAVYAATDGMIDDGLDEEEEEEGVATEDLDQAIVGDSDNKRAVLTETGLIPLPGPRTPDGFSYL